MGASAGGVESLSTLFKHLPPHPAAAFIVVTHLAPDRPSSLAEILGRCTPMSVTSAEDGALIQQGHVYLIPPGAILTVADGRLALTDRVGERNPIDILLASLADWGKGRSAAVILSGTGTDGALGVKAVRQAGGLTLALGADGAEHVFHDMAEAAIGTGFVDWVLPLESLAAKLASFIDYARSTGESAGADSRGDYERLETARTKLCGLLQSQVGHDFSGYKPSTFHRRLERRMQVHGLLDVAHYLALVNDKPEELDALFRDLLIGVTGFFRDPAAFEELTALVLPKLFEGKGQDDAIRVWIPGCSTGEEAYSIAILMIEAAIQRHSPVRLQIFATDVDGRALDIARAGRYPAKLLEGVSPERLARYFIREGKSYAVVKDIRATCHFSSHSLIRDPPFSRIDFISCRNLLIYFTSELQNRAVPLLHFALRSGGYIFLGASEQLRQHEGLFARLEESRCIFRRRDLPSRPSTFPIAALAPRSIKSSGSVAARTGRDGEELLGVIQQRVLERYAPAHLVVNSEGDIVHYSVRTGKYLEAPTGAPTRNLLAQARKGLVTMLRSAMIEVDQTGSRAERTTFQSPVGEFETAIKITIEPLPRIGDGRFRLVVFSDLALIPGGEILATPIDRDEAYVQLEAELHHTRSRLQSSIEEYEALVGEQMSANEEMLSINEELQSSNEELETSKEELQSVNEELHAVNEELEKKVREVDHANSDLRNFLESTGIAAVFLDEDLHIRSFTPAIRQVFKLQSTDCGKALSDFTPLVNCGDLTTELRSALQSSRSQERRLSSWAGTSDYLMRILPYRTQGDLTDGVVITFVDVTSLIRLDEKTALVAELNHRVKNMLAVVLAIANNMVRRCSSLEDFMVDFADRLAAMGRTHDLLSSRSWRGVGLEDLLVQELVVFADRSRFSVQGPQLHLKPKAATALGIVFHELATNGTKFGAFSNDVGRVDVRWTIETRDGRRWLALAWRESGGRPVVTPQTPGFGTELIRRTTEYEFSGTSTIEYLPDGIIVTLTAPLSDAVHS